jgi:hypothetical protein
MGDKVKLKLTRYERIIAWQLSKGDLISINDMIRNLYSNFEDGGPNNALYTVKIFIFKLSKKLEKNKINLYCQFGMGYYICKEDLNRYLDLLACEMKENTCYSKTYNRRNNASFT